MGSENGFDKIAVVAELLPATVTEAITRAEVDIQIATAHAYPRSILVLHQVIEILAWVRADYQIHAIRQGIDEQR